MNFKLNKNKFFVSVILGIVLTYFIVKSSFAQKMTFFVNLSGGYTKLVLPFIIIAVLIFLIYSLIEKKEESSLPPLNSNGLGTKPKDNLGDLGLGNYK